MPRRATKASSAILLLSLLWVGGCEHDREPSTDSNGQTKADRAAFEAANRRAISVDQAKAIVDEYMQPLETYVLSRVRAGGGDTYNRWLDDLAERIERGAAGVGEMSELVVEAEARLPRFDPADPDGNPYEDDTPITDVSFLTALVQKTRLGWIGVHLADELRHRDDAVRAAAASHLRANYRLP